MNKLNVILGISLILFLSGCGDLMKSAPPPPLKQKISLRLLMLMAE